MKTNKRLAKAILHHTIKCAHRTIKSYNKKKYDRTLKRIESVLNMTQSYKASKK